MSLDLEQLLTELRVEQIPSRPSPAYTASGAGCAPRTAQEQAEARRIAHLESLAYDRDRQLRAVS